MAVKRNRPRRLIRDWYNQDHSPGYPTRLFKIDRDGYDIEVFGKTHTYRVRKGLAICNAPLCWITIFKVGNKIDIILGKWWFERYRQIKIKPMSWDRTSLINCLYKYLSTKQRMWEENGVREM